MYRAPIELVDGANMFHIWVLPRALPFGLRDN